MKRVNQKIYLSIICILITSLSGCMTLGADYLRPEMDLPTSYKEEKNWKVAVPADTLPKGAWWQVFENQTLNYLQSQVDNNQSLKAAAARVREARSVVKFNRGDHYPRIELNPEWERIGQSENLSFTQGDAQTFNEYKIPFELSYELDLWGRVQRSVEVVEEEFQASIADFNNVVLSLRSELARNYFTLSALDAEIALLKENMKIRQRAYKIVQSLYENGEINQTDLYRAETELANVEIDLIGLQKERAEVEHSIAILVGEPPARFLLKPQVLKAEFPKVPVGLPSKLLERRPDVSEAERKMAAANARIGVAKASFFPRIMLTGDLGVASGDLDDLLSWGSRSWSIGPSISFPLFQGGKNQAKVEQMKAQYDACLAEYHGQILVAFKEVEDSLSGLQILSYQSKAIEKAVKAAKSASDISFKRYQSGLVTFLEVVDAQRVSLDAERKEVRNVRERLIMTVLLIKALGGTWS